MSIAKRKIEEHEIMIDPWNITPPHEAANEFKVDQIAMSLCNKDWKGRPIAALSFPNELVALTGSHRIEAARRIEMSLIPVLTVDGPEFLKALCHALNIPRGFGIGYILEQIQLASVGMMILSKIAETKGLSEFAKLLKAEHEGKKTLRKN